MTPALRALVLALLSAAAVAGDLLVVPPDHVGFAVIDGYGVWRQGPEVVVGNGYAALPDDERVPRSVEIIAFGTLFPETEIVFGGSLALRDPAVPLRVKSDLWADHYLVPDNGHPVVHPPANFKPWPADEPWTRATSSGRNAKFWKAALCHLAQARGDADPAVLEDAWRWVTDQGMRAYIYFDDAGLLRYPEIEFNTAGRSAVGFPPNPNSSVLIWDDEHLEGHALLWIHALTRSFAARLHAEAIAEGVRSSDWRNGSQRAFGWRLRFFGECELILGDAYAADVENELAALRTANREIGPYRVPSLNGRGWNDSDHAKAPAWMVEAYAGTVPEDIWRDAGDYFCLWQAAPLAVALLEVRALGHDCDDQIELVAEAMFLGGRRSGFASTGTEAVLVAPNPIATDIVPACFLFRPETGSWQGKASEWSMPAIGWLGLYLGKPAMVEWANARWAESSKSPMLWRGFPL